MTQSKSVLIFQAQTVNALIACSTCKHRPKNQCTQHAFDADSQAVIGDKPAQLFCRSWELDPSYQDYMVEMAYGQVVHKSEENN